MAFRSQKATGCYLGLLVAPLLLGQQEVRFEVRHDHLRKGGAGTLVIADQGLSFTETKKPKHAWNWRWQDIQQLEVGPKRVTVLTYEDSRWQAGADREYRFDLLSDDTFARAYEFLKNRLDQRFVAALADRDVAPLWEIPVKHRKGLGGSDGVLAVGRDRIVFNTDKPGESRSWRFTDVENISTTGPFDLTVTTYERARMHYGNLKNYNFQLKQPLDETRYDALWRALNAAKNPKMLNVNYMERKDTE